MAEMIDIEYTDHYLQLFRNPVLVRQFKTCSVWTADDEQSLLVIVDPNAKRLSVGKYKVVETLEQDIRRIMSMEDDSNDDDPDSGVVANSNPVSPTSPPFKTFEAPEE